MSASDVWSYIIVYNFEAPGRAGMVRAGSGRAGFTCAAEIASMNQIEEIEKGIAARNGFDRVAIINFILLSGPAEGREGNRTSDKQDDLRTRLATAMAVIHELIDEDDCWFDHHGGCQAHGYLSLEPGERCPQAVAKDLLAKYRQDHRDNDEPR
jgi:hypothetical protein